MPIWCSSDVFILYLGCGIQRKCIVAKRQPTWEPVINKKMNYEVNDSKNGDYITAKGSGFRQATFLKTASHFNES